MDIARLFKSKARKAIFQLYFTNPDSLFYLRELERILDIPVSIIRKELLRLKEEGVFISEKKGNLVYFRLNTVYPLFDELKSIVRKTIGIEGLLKEAVLKLKGVKVAFIYGSFAKAKERAKSDVDLFLIGNVDEGQLIRQLNNMEKTIKREVNYTVFSQEEYKKKKKRRDSFIIDLLSNPKIMLVGSKDDL
ncbi:MAG: ArsR family transcriptional regulator [Candidatus Omnitrophota bacterium]